MKVTEGEDYELIPAAEIENESAWDIRILKGEFTETIIRFGNVAVNEVEDNMTFNYNIIFTPDSDISEENENLSQFSGQILIDIMEQSIEDGSAVITNRND